MGGVAVSYPYRVSFPPLQGILCGRFFAGVRIFAVSASRAVPNALFWLACPPVSGGFSFSGGGGGLACASPQSDVGRASGGAFGVPHTSEGGVSLPCPDGALFHPPFWGGVYFLWIVARCSSLSLWHGKAQSGRLSRRIGKECRQVRKRVLPFSVCPCAA